MKLFSLLKNIKCRVFGKLDLEIDGLYHNDKDVKNNGLFFCIEGKNLCGRNFAVDAIKNGAVAIVCDKELKDIKVTQIIVKNVRKAMSLIACNFYGNPSKNLKVIGVTGTNGKTTTTYMIAGLINGSGKKCAIIGTNGVIMGNKIIETGMTTPDPIELEKWFSIIAKNGYEYVCIEASAHAIYLEKLEGVYFDVMIFTNLTEDHLDYFVNMQNYYEAKKKIFSKKYCKVALINIDDCYGRKLFESINIEKITYSIKDKTANFYSNNQKIDNFMQYFTINDNKIRSRFLGQFNVMNLLCAIACYKIIGLDCDGLQNIIDKLPDVPGRFNCFYINDRLYVIDFAHTPDGLNNVLRLCKSLNYKGNLICVFGCGGNRETQKRSKMGEISSNIADFTIITSDNPRFEKRIDIAKDIEKGMTNDKYKIILDRKEAIKFANDYSNVGDIILIAGKGAENYIDENGVKTYYSDFDEIEKLR